MIDENELNVWFNGLHVGYLWENDLGLIAFQYSEEWLTNNERSFPISYSLPLQEEPYDSDRKNSQAHDFFTNLLPEAQSRNFICKQLKISNDNDFALLREIGGDCAGALSVSYYTPEGDLSYQELDDNELLTLLKDRNYKRINEKAGLAARLSLAGAQEKVPVKFSDERISIPLNGSPSTHILKFSSKEYNNVPAFETVTTWTARNLGLDVIEIEFYRFKGEEYTLATRYDRTITENGTTRIHQEDFCQSLGYKHNKKYENDGGPTFADCYNLVKERSNSVLADTNKILEWQIFNFLIGNSDAHAKNLSFIYEDRDSCRLSLIYDLVCTQAYPQLSKELALKIGGELNPGRVRRQSWEKQANDCGVKPKYVLSLVKKLSEQITGAYKEAKEEFETKHDQYEALQQIENALKKNLRIIQHFTL